MKRIIVFTLFAICLTACGNRTAETNNVANTEADSQLTLPEYHLEALLAVAEQQVDKEIVLKGFVTHTCKHSGKRCFITGEDGKTSVRVEAKGEIGGFNRELVGSELAIRGIVRENRLTKEYIDNAEKELKDGAMAEDGSAESCQAELTNISSMKAWMKANNKDYYSIYYIDGLDYEVCE